MHCDFPHRIVFIDSLHFDYWLRTHFASPLIVINNHSIWAILESHWCHLAKLEVEDAHWLEQAKEGSHPAIGMHPRFRLVEETPLVEQVDASARGTGGAPHFELLPAP